MQTTMTLGKRIERDRRERNWNQYDFAKGLGVTQGAVSKWENDERYPSLAHLRAIATVLEWDERTFVRYALRDVA